MTQWAELDANGLAAFFSEEAPGRVPVEDDQWQDYLQNEPFRHFVQAPDGSWVTEPFTPPPPPLATLKRAKGVEFALEMDAEIRALAGLSAEDSALLPDYLELALAIQLGPQAAGQIWQHFRSKVAEIRAAADQTALDAIPWRP